MSAISSIFRVVAGVFQIESLVPDFNEFRVYLKKSKKEYWIYHDIVGAHDFSCGVEDLYKGGFNISFLGPHNAIFIGRVFADEVTKGIKVAVSKFISPEQEKDLKALLDQFTKSTKISIRIAKNELV